MSKMGREKGQRAERAVIGLLQPVVAAVYESVGLKVPILQRNTLQADRGGPDIAGLPWLALEVKHREQLAVETWWGQTVRQAQVTGGEPILIYKQNNVKFRVRLWATLVIHGSLEQQAHVVEIGLEEFLVYFRARCNVEMKRELC